ncbi:hypothetical protein EV677_0083 [Herminiimonas fonticola]|uniref:Uncharacterized protein n=2 Tax=Herminiimonas fonticola TaxID=303380 RepID=A0A4R6GH80_9BURK|nr:hypothetical protein Hfont_0070 [Herminiimonas fonticola]TDN93554.1 hypothetical protein EV677_0083 [Herminiimonas fonticola]
MRRIITGSAFIFAALSMVGSASASSPDAWQVLYDTTAHACLKKSELKKARVVEGPLLFSNTILYKIKGVWPQAHMKGKTGKVYCLHPYPNGEPEIVDAP